MKRLQILALAAFFGLALPWSTQAQIIDTWTAPGGAWTPANQPDFTAAPGGGGTLYTDEAIAAGTNTAGLNTGATWSSAIPAWSPGPPPSGPNPGSGLYNDYYYTLFSTPVITINTTNVLAGVETITFELTTATTLLTGSVGLNFSGLQTAASFNATLLGVDPNFGANVYAYTWTWEVGALALPSSFSLSWTTPSYHTAYFQAELSQVQAVPEPAAGTLAILGIGGTLLWRARRKATRAKTNTI